MKRLILTSSGGACLEKTGRADVTVFFMFRFAWGELPTPQKLASFLAARTDQGQSDHWSDYVLRRIRDSRALSLIEFCKLNDEVELWFDPTSTAQFELIWLLDFFSSCPDVVSRLKLRLLDVDFIGAEDAFLAKGNIPTAPVTAAVLETASLSWQAYRSATPEACFDLLKRDFERLAAVATGSGRFAEGASWPHRTRRYGTAVAGARWSGIQTPECVVLPSGAAPYACVR